jgi:uncharacterized protein YdeI (YjbR/CyaY-like superfamily)
MEKFRDKDAWHFKSRKDWRKWLEKNHVSSEPIWLILHGKNSGVKGVKYDEAVEEALCFGWIDSVVYKRDEKSRYQYFGKRKTGSVWSESNRDRVARLTEAGLMTEAGQKFVDIAKANGAWQTAGDVHNTLIPDDLQQLLNKNQVAHDNFLAFPPSSRKIILHWIHSAKRAETREKRLLEVVSLAEKNIRANHPVKKVL